MHLSATTCCHRLQAAVAQQLWPAAVGAAGSAAGRFQEAASNLPGDCQHHQQQQQQPQRMQHAQQVPPPPQQQQLPISLALATGLVSGWQQPPLNSSSSSSSQWRTAAVAAAAQQQHLSRPFSSSAAATQQAEAVAAAQQASVPLPPDIVAAQEGPALLYRQGLESGMYRPDPLQQVTVQKLQAVFDHLREAHPAPQRPSGLTLVDTLGSQKAQSSW